MRPLAKGLLGAAAAAALVLGFGPAGFGPATARAAPVVPPSHLGVVDADGHAVVAAPVFEATTERDGRLVFDDAAAPLARIPAALGPGRRLVVAAPGTAAVLVPAGPFAAFVRLSPASPLSGELRWDGTAPAAGLAVDADPLDHATDLVHRTTTDLQGRYVFAHLPPGRFHLRVRRAEGAWEDLGVAVAGTTSSKVSLARGATLTGELRDGDLAGPAAAGVRVRLSRLTEVPGVGSVVLEAQVGAAGQLVFAQVPPGVYEAVLLDADLLWDGPPPRVPVTGPTPRPLSVWWVRHRGVITGVVQDKEGKPLHLVQVALTPPVGVPEPAGGFFGSELDVLAQGARYRLRGLAPSAGWTLLVSAPGYSPAILSPVDVVGNRTTELPTLRLAAAWSLDVVVRDPEGKPVRGSNVSVAPSGRPSPFPTDAVGRQLWQMVTTDVEGRARLVDLPESDVLVRASAPGYVDASAEVQAPAARKSIEQSLVLAPAGSIHGRVTGEGATPAAVRVRAVARGTSLVRFTRPDADGLFELKDLPFSPIDLEAVPAEGGDDLVLGRLDAVLPGARETVTLPLAPTRAVSGTVRGLDPAGPAAVVRLELARRDPWRETTPSAIAAQVTVPATSTEAPFAFPTVPPGTATLRVVQGTRDGGAVQVRVEGGDLQGVELRLPEPAQVSGRVSDARTRSPAVGARVTLVRLDGSGPAAAAAAPPASTAADEDGAFSFLGVGPGLWRVEATDRDAAKATAVVRLVEGGRAEAGTLTLSLGGSVDGRLADRNGRGVAGVLVRALTSRDLEEAARTSTGEDGAFHVAPLPPGLYRLRVEDRPGAEPTLEAEVEVVEGETTKVDLSASGRAELSGTVRRRGAVVPGVLLEAEGEGAGGDHVLRRTTSDAFGKFRLAALAAGRYVLRALDGGVESETRVALADGDRVDRDVELGEGRIAGTVRTVGGDAVGDVEVLASPAAPAPSGVDGRTRTGPDGRFALAGLPVGRYRLEFVPPGRASRVVEGAFAEVLGAGAPVDVVLATGASLEVHVRDEGGRGVGAADVWVEDAAGNALHARPFYTSPSGLLRVDGLPAGPARVRVHARGLARPRPVPVRLVDGGSTAVEATLRPAGAIRLLVAAGRDPVARARVDLLRLPERERVESRRTLRRDDDAALFGTTTRVGALVLDDLEEGEYLLVVSAGRELLEARVPVRVRRGDVTDARVLLEFRPR